MKAISEVISKIQRQQACAQAQNTISKSAKAIALRVKHSSKSLIARGSQPHCRPSIQSGHGKYLFALLAVDIAPGRIGGGNS
jgi:hypothetical protein